MKQAGQHAGDGGFGVKFTAPLAAIFLYGIVSIFLYRGAFSRLKGFEVLFPVWPVIAAGGCFWLSKRWLGSVFSQWIAGAVYGFGPYLLSFGAYHPLAGFCAAAVPWLFCPAALRRPYSSGSPVLRIEKLLLTLLPFGLIFLYFWIPAQPWAGPYSFMPVSQTPEAGDLQALAGVYPGMGQEIVLGLYPAAAILSLMGLFVYLHVLRIAALLPVLTGLVLMFGRGWGPAPPMIWGAVVMLFLSILAGLGAQSFAWGGVTDRKWFLYCIPAAAVLGALTLWLKFPGDLSAWITHPAAMYGLSILLIGLMYVTVQLQSRGHWLRWTAVYAVTGINLWMGARQILIVLYH